MRMHPRRIKLMVERDLQRSHFLPNTWSFFSPPASTMALPHPLSRIVYRFTGFEVSLPASFCSTSFEDTSSVISHELASVHCHISHFSSVPQLRMRNVILHPKDLSALPDLAVFSSRSPCTQPSDPWLCILPLGPKATP